MQITELRKLAGKTQHEVARDLNQSISTINRHEHGKTPLSDFHRAHYATYYGVPAESIEQPSRDEARAA